MRIVVVANVTAILLATGVLGCGTCGKKTEQAPPAAEAESSAPAPAAEPGGPSPPAPPRAEPAPPPPPAPPAGGKARLVEEMLTRLASFWDLPVKKHVILRVQTQRLLAVPEEVHNPIDIPPVTLAVLDLEEGGGPEEAFDGLVQQLYERLFEQKVFTAAAPVLVYWEPFHRTPKPRWSVAVPVGKDTRVTPPLRLHQMPAMRVHAERIAMKEAKKFAGSPGSEKTSLFEISRSAIANMRKKTALTVAPDFVILRLPDIRLSPIGPESVFEVLFVGKERPSPGPAAPAAP